jgi:hypothetical protein
MWHKLRPELAAKLDFNAKMTSYSGSTIVWWRTTTLMADPTIKRRWDVHAVETTAPSSSWRKMSL